MKLLLDSGNYPAIATHDEALIEETRGYAASRKIAPDAFEFQMLYGIRRDLQRKLVAAATVCGSTFPSARPGIPTTCAVWRSVRRTFSSWCGTCSGGRPAAPRVSPKQFPRSNSLLSMRYWAYFARSWLPPASCCTACCCCSIESSRREPAIPWLPGKGLPQTIGAVGEHGSEAGDLRGPDGVVRAGNRGHLFIVRDQRYRCRVCLRRLRIARRDRFLGPDAATGPPARRVHLPLRAWNASRGRSADFPVWPIPNGRLNRATCGKICTPPAARTTGSSGGGGAARAPRRVPGTGRGGLPAQARRGPQLRGYPAIATHDEALIERTRSHAASRKIPPDAFEFQMLYGIRRGLQRKLVRDGYPTTCPVWRSGRRTRSSWRGTCSGGKPAADPAVSAEPGASLWCSALPPFRGPGTSRNNSSSAASILRTPLAPPARYNCSSLSKEDSGRIIRRITVGGSRRSVWTSRRQTASGATSL